MSWIQGLESVSKEKFYLPLFFLIVISLFLFMTYIDQILFVNPFAFAVPSSRVTPFTLILGISVMAGLTVPIEIIKIIKKDFYFQDAKGFLSTFLGISVSCGCSAGIGLGIVTVLGATGSSLLGFLQQYQTPIRIVSIILLIYSFYFEVKSYGQLYCRIK